MQNQEKNIDKQEQPETFSVFGPEGQKEPFRASPLKQQEPIIEEKIVSTPVVKKAVANTIYGKMEKGDESIFFEGYKPVGFDKTYGGKADEDFIIVANKFFNADDGFVYLFNARAGFLFTILVPVKYSNMDSVTLAQYRVDARSCTLKPGAEYEMIEKHCKRVAQNLRYEKNR